MIFPKLLAYSIAAGGVYAIVAGGFLLQKSVAGFLNLGFGFLIGVGAYAGYSAERAGVCHPVAIIACGVVSSAIVGGLSYHLLFKPLRLRSSNPLPPVLLSLGLYVFVVNAVSLLFGSDTKLLGTLSRFAGAGNGYWSVANIFTICTAAVVVIGLMLFMKYTRLGKAMRTVSNDAELARICGIDSDRVILWAFAIGSGLAGLAGILMAMDTGMTPTMGMRPLMMGVTAMIIGGKESIPGIVLGALLLAFAQQFGAYYIGSEWQDAIAFAILLVFLLFRPQGFLGVKN